MVRAGGKSWVRWIDPGGSFQCSNDPQGSLSDSARRAESMRHKSSGRTDGRRLMTAGRPTEGGCCAGAKAGFRGERTMSGAAKCVRRSRRVGLGRRRGRRAGRCGGSGLVWLAPVYDAGAPGCRPGRRGTGRRAGDRGTPDEVRQNGRSGTAWGELGQVLLAHEFDGPADACFAQAERFDANRPAGPTIAALP